MSVGQKYERTLAERIERAVVVTAGDLSLLVSLYTARLMVWHAVRRRDQQRAMEHAEQRKQFGRVNEGGHAGGSPLLRGALNEETDASASAAEKLRQTSVS